jgi:hypothetical protein
LVCWQLPQFQIFKRIGTNIFLKQRNGVFLPRFFPAVRCIFYSETQNKRMPLPSGLKGKKGFFCQEINNKTV